MKPGKILKKFLCEGRRVIIRYPKLSDLDDLLALINSIIEERAYISLQKKRTRKEEQKWLKNIMVAIKKKKKILLVLEVDGKVIGNSIIESVNGSTQDHIGVFGIILKREIRGLGLAAKISKVVINEAKKKMKLKIVKLNVLSTNKRAWKIYKKLGFRELGVVKKGYKHYGHFYDDILMVKYL